MNRRRNLRQRIITALVALAMIFTTMPQLAMTAHAEEGFRLQCVVALDRLSGEPIPSFTARIERWKLNENDYSNYETQQGSGGMAIFSKNWDDIKFEAYRLVIQAEGYEDYIVPGKGQTPWYNDPEQPQNRPNQTMRVYLTPVRTHHPIIYHVPEGVPGTPPQASVSTTDWNIDEEIVGTDNYHTPPTSRDDHWAPLMQYQSVAPYSTSYWCTDLNDPSTVLSHDTKVKGEMHLYSKWRKVDKLVSNVRLNVWAKAGDEMPKGGVENEEISKGLITAAPKQGYDVTYVSWDPDNYDARDTHFVEGKTYRVRVVLDAVKDGERVMEDKADAFFKGWTSLRLFMMGNEMYMENPEDACPLSVNGQLQDFDNAKGASIDACYATSIAYYFYYTVPKEVSHRHSWDAGKVVVPATIHSAGVRRYSCSECGETKDETIARLSDPAGEYGDDGTAVGPGASAAAADKAIRKNTSEKDIKGSKYAPLKFKSGKQGKKSIKLSWTKQKKAVKYVVYGSPCNGKGKIYRPVKLATVKGGSYNVKKIGKAALKKGSYYKFVLVALDKNDRVVSTSKMIHVATKGGKVGNHKKVATKAKIKKNGKASKKDLSLSSTKLKKGKSLKLKATMTPVKKKLKVKKHVGVRFESSNPKVATVSGSGKIKAKAKGSCTIYAYAQNGVSKSIKLRVK